MPARWVETGKMGRASHEVAAATAVGDIGSTRQGSSFREYFALLKPRVMSLVVFTGGVGLAAPQGSVDPLTAFCTLLFMTIGAGASGALNMWYDADIDAVMRRTQRRPIPRGTVPAENALIFGTVLSIFSVAALAATVNWLAAGLLAFTIFFYIFIYTAGLKRRTPQNIVIGGAAGALPPMIGWAGATGTMDLGACALFLIIFLWTPPHFWSLAIARSGDYEKVGVPMMPNVVGNHSTANQILVYAVLLAVSTALPVMHGDAGLLYAVPAALLNMVLIWRAIVLWRVVDDVEKAPKAAMRLFGFSILYLFALFLALLIGAR